MCTALCSRVMIDDWMMDVVTHLATSTFLRYVLYIVNTNLPQGLASTSSSSFTSSVGHTSAIDSALVRALLSP